STRRAAPCRSRPSAPRHGCAAPAVARTTPGRRSRAGTASRFPGPGAPAALPRSVTTEHHPADPPPRPLPEGDVAGRSARRTDRRAWLTIALLRSPEEGVTVNGWWASNFGRIRIQKYLARQFRTASP